MILHVLTACSRPEFLPGWSQEIAKAAALGVDLRWHVAFDIERQHVGGQAVKNRMLDSITGDGWVWIGDDDNVLDPGMLLAVAEYDAKPVGAVIFAQRRGRHVAPPSTALNRVDAAQIVARRSAIGDHRLPEEYNGDGQLIAAIAKTARVALDHRVLTKYNGRIPC